MLYELTGDEYSCAGMWFNVIIQTGSLKDCMNAEGMFKGEYKNMHINKLGKSDSDLAKFMSEFIE